jgi:hypothetical protein
MKKIKFIFNRKHQCRIKSSLSLSMIEQIIEYKNNTPTNIENKNHNSDKTVGSYRNQNIHLNNVHNFESVTKLISPITNNDVNKLPISKLNGDLASLNEQAEIRPNIKDSEDENYNQNQKSDYFNLLDDISFNTNIYNNNYKNDNLIDKRIDNGWSNKKFKKQDSNSLENLLKVQMNILDEIINNEEQLIKTDEKKKNFKLAIDDLNLLSKESNSDNSSIMVKLTQIKSNNTDEIPSNSYPMLLDEQPESNKSELINKDKNFNINNDLKPSHSSFTKAHTNGQIINDLPPYWEARVDNFGRIFYIDHLNRTTTWKRPKYNIYQTTQDIVNQRIINSEIDKQRLDKRYQSIRRTINQNIKLDSDVIFSNKSKIKNKLNNSESSSSLNILLVNNNNNNLDTNITMSSKKNENLTDSTSSNPTLNDSTLKQPGLLFILRPDLQALVKNNLAAKDLIKRSSNLILILQRIKTNPVVYYKKYQHNKELVKFLNMFCDTNMPLPTGWEMKYERNNKIFFVDHNSKSTTFIDPRLPQFALTENFCSLDSNSAGSSSHITTITQISPTTTTESNLNSKIFTLSTTIPHVQQEQPLFQEKNQSILSCQNSCHSHMSMAPFLPPPPPPSIPPPIPPPPQTSYHTSESNYQNSMSSNDSINPFTISNCSNPLFPAKSPTSSVVVSIQGKKSSNLNTNISYSDTVVSFLKQTNIFDIIKKNNIQLTSKQKEKLNLIRQGGRNTYDRMCADLDLASIVSQLEDLIMCFVNSSNNISDHVNNDSVITGAVANTIASSNGTVTTSNSSSKPPSKNTSINNRRDYQRGFQSKLRNFYRKLESKGYGQGPQKSKIIIRRDKLLDDARIKFMQLSKHDLRKNKIFICFHGEEGLDYGGPAREFFYLLSRELFNPYYGLFEYSASDMYTVQISPMSTFQEHVLEWFQFAGRVLGVALIHQYLLDAFFTRPFYKALLKDINWTLSDLETLDPEFCQSLLWIKENDITDILDLTFSVTEDKCGQIIERDLKENGRNISVTEKNKLEYIQKVIKWRVERGVQKQAEALVKGFYEVVDAKQVQTFDARELELVLCGTIEIDVSDWKKNTDYRSGYHSTHQTILWFWQAVDKFDNEQKLKLLQFVTGTSSIPYEGFAALRGSNGPRKFCIERWGTVDALPRAHTCFNRLDLPSYPSFETLYDKLILAIEETTGFGIQ